MTGARETPAAQEQLAGERERGDQDGDADSGGEGTQRPGGGHLGDDALPFMLTVPSSNLCLEKERGICNKTTSIPCSRS